LLFQHDCQFQHRHRIQDTGGKNNGTDNRSLSMTIQCLPWKLE